MSLSLYRLTELRALEENAQKGLAPGALMLRAGEAAADQALRHRADASGPIIALAGPGNNGGDALTAATRLHQRGVKVQVALLEPAEHYRGDAARAWHNWQQLGGVTLPVFEPSDASIVIDGLFGIGLNKPVPAQAADWITRLNQWQVRTRRPVLALDIPSGIEADTGRVLGRAVHATHTLSFLGGKAGLYTGDGPDYCGRVTVQTLGASQSGASGFLAAPEDFSSALRARARNSNKGSFGSLGVLAGAQGMVGAGFLCARMGVLAGAGRVYLDLPGDDAPVVDLVHPELMMRKNFDGLRLSAAVAGPGLGETDTARPVLDALLQGEMPLVLDADALNAMARDGVLYQAVRARASAKITTPHPLEAGRLLKLDVAAIQADRVGAAQSLAESLQAIVVLKGAGTVLAAPGGRWAINPTGNPALATGGTGDILSGLLGALLAQGWAPWEAALGGVWMHGRAADALVERGIGPIGVTSQELTEAIRQQINELTSTFGAARRA